MVKVRENFAKMYKNDLMYKSCNKNLCNQKHLLSCEALMDKSDLIDTPDYNDIWNGTLSEKLHIAKIIYKKFTKLLKRVSS